MLLDDERAAHRHHHQHADDAAYRGERDDLEDVEVLLRTAARDEQERRDREHDARGNRFARRPDRLDDVVLEDRGLAEALEDRDREHGNRDRGRHREPGAERQVHRHRAEDEAEDGTEHHGLDGELGRRR